MSMRSPGRTSFGTDTRPRRPCFRRHQSNHSPHIVQYPTQGILPGVPVLDRSEDERPTAIDGEALAVRGYGTRTYAPTHRKFRPRFLLCIEAHELCEKPPDQTGQALRGEPDPA